MNKHHEELLVLIKKAPKKQKGHFDANKYAGNSDFFHNISVPELGKIGKVFFNNNKDLSTTELDELVLSLINSTSHEEKKLVGEILYFYKDYKLNISFDLLWEIIGKMKGWEQIDTVCQSNFKAKEFLYRKDEWILFIQKLNQSENISHRRASLVLLIKTLNEIEDNELSKLTLKMIDNLKAEKDILVTKAISWILREMIKNYRSEIIKYLENNKDTLPKIAVRETRKKLETGKK